ncbi:MAG: OB-fold nucleic acid binding domain-containing protein [Nanobdellota archaeon]
MKLEDSLLLRYSLVISSVGLLVLFFLVDSYEPEQVDPGDIGDKEKDDYVSLSGEVLSVDEGNVTEILLRDYETAEVVVFEELDLDEGQGIVVEGKVDSFRGENQVIGDEIRKI